MVLHLSRLPARPGISVCMHILCLFYLVQDLGASGPWRHDEPIIYSGVISNEQQT